VSVSAAASASAEAVAATGVASTTSVVVSATTIDSDAYASSDDGTWAVIVRVGVVRVNDYRRRIIRGANA
jgi:hypothetical protein